MSSIVDDILNEKISKKRTLHQYARLKKLPEIIKLGYLLDSERQFLLDNVLETPISNDRGVKNRVNTRVYGVEHDYTTPAGKTYNQRHIDNFDFHIDCLNSFEDGKDFLSPEECFDWRYAELEPQSGIPEHLDDPFTYRLVVMLEGEQTGQFGSVKITMKAGEVWFLNSAFKHSIYNHTNKKRIALLGRFNINDTTTQLLRDRAGK